MLEPVAETGQFSDIGVDVTPMEVNSGADETVAYRMAITASTPEGDSRAEAYLLFLRNDGLVSYVQLVSELPVLAVDVELLADVVVGRMERAL